MIPNSSLTGTEIQNDPSLYLLLGLCVGALLILAVMTK